MIPLPAPRHGRAGKETLAAFLLVAVTAAVFLRATSNGFIELFDDSDYVVKNAMVLKGLSLEGLRWAFTTNLIGNWHPLTWLSHMADVSLFGLNPAGHHTVSVLFHAANTALLFLFLFRTTARWWTSILASLLFGIHPLHVESVAWISERKDVLSTFFMLCSLLSYHAHVQYRRRRLYLLAAAFMAMGLMAKPMLVSLPLLLILIDYWPLNRKDSLWLNIRDHGLEKIPFLALAMASALITLITQSGAGYMAGNTVIPLATRLLQAAASYGTYLWKTLWPANLAVFYHHPGLHIPARAWGFGLAALLLGSLFVFGFRRHRFLLTGWLWYLITLIPVIGIVQIGSQAYADRYTYVPLVGLFIMAAFSLAAWVDARPPLKWPVVATVSLSLSLLAVRTVLLLPAWADDVSLFEQAARVDPGARNHLLLGRALLDRNQADRARDSLRTAIRLDPTLHEAEYLLAQAEFSSGRLESALALYLKLASLEPSNPSLFEVAGDITAQLEAFDRSAELYRKAWDLNPTSGQLAMKTGNALSRLKRFNEADEFYRRGLATGTYRVDILYNQAVSLFQRGNLAAAREKLLEVLRIDPAHRLARQNLDLLSETPAGR